MGLVDVSSSYTSIPHDIGIRAVQYFLTKSGEINSRQVHFLVDSVRFSLTYNYFTFLDQFYLQLRGTAIGANFAPAYANLAMGYWEGEHIWANNPFARHLVFNGRYIDDILLIRDSGPDVFSSFVIYSMGLSFTHVLDPKELVFYFWSCRTRARPLSQITMLSPLG